MLFLPTLPVMVVAAADEWAKFGSGRERWRATWESRENMGPWRVELHVHSAWDEMGLIKDTSLLVRERVSAAAAEDEPTWI